MAGQTASVYASSAAYVRHSAGGAGGRRVEWGARPAPPWCERGLCATAALAVLILRRMSMVKKIEIRRWQDGSRGSYVPGRLQKLHHTSKFVSGFFPDKSVCSLA